jgi:PKD repeat protein
MENFAGKERHIDMFRIVIKPKSEKIDPSKAAKAILRLAFLICLFVFLPLHASATTYYAATNGNDSWDGLYPDNSLGGSHGPKKTLNTVLGMLNGGDTMYIRGGVYQQFMSRAMPNNDVANNWITIAGYPGEKAVIDGNNYTIGYRSGLRSALISMDGGANSGHSNWIRIKDLEVRYSGDYGIHLWSCSHVEITNVYSHHNQNCGICCSGMPDLSIEGCQYVTIDGCRSWYNSMLSEFGKSGAYSSGVACRNGCDNVIFRNCIVWENWGEGINNFHSTYVTVEDCISYDNLRCNLYLDNIFHGLFQRNLCYYTVGNVTAGYPYANQDNLLIADETDEPGPNNRYIIVKNNFFLSRAGRWALNWNPADPTGGFIDFQLINNTFLSNSSTYATIRVGGSPVTSNSIFKNNIFIQEGSYAIASVPAMPGVTWDYNGWSKTTDSDAQGAHDYVGDPKLAKSGSFTPRNLTADWGKIASDSPVKDIGTTISNSNEDYWGTRRPQGSAYDIGAHELASGTSSLTASATGSPTSGQAPLTVNFTGSASGGTSPYSYRWTFGDSSSSTSQNPSHTYSSASTYTATLTVTDSASATASKSVTITVSAVTSPLTANASASPTSGQTPLTVNFTGSASGGVSPYTYRWTFGDGGSSTAQNPSHTYSTAGTHTATLTVTDSQSTASSKSLSITATSAPTQLAASASASPTSGQAPLSVNFTGSASGGTAPYSYSWAFGDGGSSTSQNPSHTYSSNGSYTATLTVTDNSFANASATVNIAVADAGTSADLSLAAQTGAPAPGNGGTTDPSPGNHTYAIGSTISIKSIANTDYRFSRWSGDIADSSIFTSPSSLTMDNDRSVSATFCTKCADVNGDLKITPADAQMAFDIYLKKISSPTWCELENADVNSSGTKLQPKVTPADAQMIFNKYLKRGTADGTCSGNSRTATVAALTAGSPNSNLTIDDLAFTPEMDILIPIILESPSEVTAFGFDFVFPSNALTFIGLEKTELTKGYDLIDANVIPPSPSVNRVEAGAGTEGTLVLRVGGYKAKPNQIPSMGVFVTLVFRGTGEFIDPNSTSIITTYDDLQNASVINRMNRQRNAYRIRERNRLVGNEEKKSAGNGKMSDF